MIKSQNIFTLLLLLCFSSTIGLKEQSSFKGPLRSTVINIIVTGFYSYQNESMNSVGRKGVLVFLTDYKKDEEGIFEKLDYNKPISFEANIMDRNETEYPVNCTFQHLIDEPLLVFCELDEQFSQGEYSISFHTSFYNESEFIVYSNESFYFTKLDDDIPFLYSNSQNIFVKINQESIEIKMKIISYEEQTLLIGNSKGIFEVLYDCETKSNELICLIQKDKLLQIMSGNKQQFSITYITSNYLLGPLFLVKDITINNYGIEKEDLFVGITKLIDDKCDIFKGIVYETNITNISNILMGFSSFKMKFENTEYKPDCFFRKYENTPLLLICQMFNYSNETHLSKIENEMILDDINIKYNFRIQPVDNKETFYNKFSSFFFIYFTYPRILDFTYQDTFVITLSGYISDNMKIRLNMDADDLECEIEVQNSFLKCVVHKNHFKGKRSGYYSLIHVDDDLNEKTIFYEIPPFEVIVNNSEAVNIITVEEIYDYVDVIGKKGIIALETSFEDQYNIFDEIDIEKRTSFTTTVSNENKDEFTINCNLFKFTYEPYVVFCELDESIPGGNYSINFDQRSFIYNNNTIIINSKESFYFKKFNIDIPNLYSDVQNIYAKENEDTIEIKFNLISYHNEHLFISNMKSTYVSLEDCQVVENKLICKYQREKLLEIMSSNEDIFNLYYIHNNYQDGHFSLVKSINIIYNNTEKEDIFVGITKPIETNMNIFSFMVYETNITDILNIKSGFSSFIIDFENSNYSFCGFSKYENTPLLLVCYIFTSESYVKLQDIDNEIILDNINIKYNFRIQPVNNIDKIYISTSKKFFSFLTFPKFLDFTSQDSITLSIYGDMTENKGIRLNKDSKDLKCELLREGLFLQCIVPKSHFKGKKSGYYSLVYVDDSQVTTFYDIPPFEVVLNETEPDIDTYFITVEEINPNDIGKQGVLSFLTDFMDEDNIFDQSDVEIQTNFKANITSNQEFEIDCRFVKYIGYPLIIFCELDENILSGNYSIKFDNIDFSYKNNYTIIVNSDISFEFKKLDVDIPNLYADVQNITIEKKTDIIQLKFKINSYHNEKIFIQLIYEEEEESWGTDIFNYLDNCTQENKELICSLEADNLLQIMASTSNSFYPLYIDNNYNAGVFNLVNTIYINYYNVEKEDVFVRITKPLQNIASKFSCFAYETNVTDISNVLIRRDMFNMDFENEYKNEEETNNGYCTFRKYENNPLLLLCYIDSYTDSNFMYLKEIKTEINLSEINIKYNFKIQPYNDKDIIEFYEYDKYIDIIYYYPQVLDFTSQDEFIITYIGNFGKNDSYPEIPKIRLNIDSEDLNCQLLSEENSLLECVVPKSHFEGKKSGNYYTIHINDLNNQTILYQIPPIKVILNDESEEEQVEPEEEEQVEPEEEEVEPEEEEEQIEPEEEEEEQIEPEEEQVEPEEEEQIEPEEEEVEPEEEEQVEPEEEEQVEPEEEEQVEPEEEEQVEPEEEEQIEPEEEEQVEPEEEEQVEPEEEEQAEPEEEEQVKPEEEEESEEEEEEEEGKTPNNGGGKSSNTKTVLIVVFSVIGGILLLLAIFFLIHFLRKRNITKEDVEQGASNRELLESQELKESQ